VVDDVVDVVDVVDVDDPPPGATSSVEHATPIHPALSTLTLASTIGRSLANEPRAFA